MSIIEKEGKTVEQAIDKGLKELGLSRDEVQVEIVSLGSTGFLGMLGAKPAKVRLKIQVQPRVRKIVEAILSRMGFPGTVRSFSEDGGRLTAIIDSDLGEKYLQANNGAALDAMEYLIGKIFHEAEQDVHLDIGGFRRSQGDHLKTMALDLARKAKETGQEQKLPPMPPHQRKIIHKSLENHPDVRTFAVGEGDRRRVIIAPRLGSGQAPRQGFSAGSGHRSGQAPRQDSGQAPPRQGPSAGSGHRSGQAPRHDAETHRLQKAKPEPKPKAGPKPGKREQGRKPQPKHGPKPARPGTGQAGQAQASKPPAPLPPKAAEPTAEAQDTGFVPRSRKKTRH